MARVTVQVQSDGRKKSVSKLNYNELNQLVNQLESDVSKAKNNPNLQKQILNQVSDAKTEIAKRIIK
jgi:hypothetical protein|tara:strand:+ start:1404 stop:1604 length:201 start_codon:yes stop_codon:yes gene_type:complete